MAAVATRSVLLAAAFVAATRAVVFEGGPFREQVVCEAQGRPLGTCMNADSCKGAAGVPGGSCGLRGAESSDWRCCQPSAQPPAAQPGHGARSRQACKQYSETSQKQSCDNFQPLSDGREVRQGDFPYFAGVGFAGKSGIVWSCGGSLISENFVLTDAVCARGSPSTGSAIKVRLGAVDFRNEGNGGAGAVQELDVAEVLLHPEYSPRAPADDNIALLRLAGRATLSRAVRPACLYPEERFPVPRAVVAGFGSDVTSGEIGTLRKVDIPFVSTEKCNEIYKKYINFLPKGIDSLTQFCAGEKGRDTCAGDSGAPVVIKEAIPVCTYQIIGLTSLGRMPCGLQPAIYTKLFSYLPWIEKIVWG